MTRAGGLDRSLRELAWLRVELPPLRARDDKASLIGASFRAAAERQGREAALEPNAAEILSDYGWPGNLRELDAVADASCAAASGARIDAGVLRIGGRAPQRVPAAEPLAPSPLSEPSGSEQSERVGTSDEDLTLATFASSESSTPATLPPLDEAEPSISTSPRSRTSSSRRRCPRPRHLPPSRRQHPPLRRRRPESRRASS